MVSGLWRRVMSTRMSLARQPTGPTWPKYSHWGTFLHVRKVRTRNWPTATRDLVLLDTWPMKMEAVLSYETLVSTENTTRRYDHRAYTRMCVFCFCVKFLWQWTLRFCVCGIWRCVTRYCVCTSVSEKSDIPLVARFAVLSCHSR
jgi:hypothetical protein